MASRRPKDDEGVSLFPFLSIIACLIGVLTLLIAAMALAQMGSNEGVASLEQYEKVQRELKEIQEEIERLKEEVGDEALQRANEMSEKQRALAAANQRLDQLLKRIIELRKLLANLAQEVEGAADGASKDGMDAERRGNELARLKAEIEQLEKSVVAQKEQLAQLDKELEERDKPPVESEVSVLPSGSGLGFEPVFVECTGGSVVIHQGDELPRILATELDQNETFLKLLVEVAASPKKTVVFLIRDNGLGTYRTARKLANEHEAKNGKLPVIGKGRLDLSHFSKAR